MSRPADLSCPACAIEVGSAETSCPRCGLPTVLRDEAQRALAARDPYVAPSPSPSSPPAGRRASSARAVPKREREAVEGAMDELDRQLAVLHRLDADSNGVSGEILRAARAEMHGDPAAAAELLKGAAARTAEAIHTTTERRWRDLEARRESLERQRLLSIPHPAPTAPPNAPHRPGDSTEALLAAEEEVRRIEEEFQALRSPLHEIDALISLGSALEIDTSRQESELRVLREGIASRPGGLPAAVARADEILGELRARLPLTISEELDRHAATLSPYPEDHPPASSARALHARAREHLERGALGDAATALAELRRSIESLEAARSEAPAPEPEEPPEEIPVPRLLEKARRLAMRVRALPPESELAETTAAGIREATDLVKERRLAEAEETLNRLMAALDDGDPAGSPESST